MIEEEEEEDEEGISTKGLIQCEKY